MIPKRHVKNIKTLVKGDVGMLRDMRTLGQRVMEENFGEEGNYEYHFHVPPFNSIDHLHMHCFLLPYRSLGRRIQNSGCCCWSTTAQAVIRSVSRL